MIIPIILKELAKIGVVALTEESAKSFVETKIKPIFENWGVEDSRSIELEECLSEYLLRCYGNNNIMTTIVFGKLQKTLEELYIPLTLEEYGNEDKQWVIDENCYDILDQYSKILIVDMAGMGKSTIVKYFACQGINLDKSIPIVVELRKLRKNQAILEYLQKQINSFDKKIKVEEIIDILKKGDFVVFFDGYDEIANENKPDVLDAIQEFTSKATNTKVIITSREEDDLNSLGEFKCVNIKPLTEEEAYKLIKKYDNDGNISKKLIKRLKDDSSMNILKEFLENPLLVSLLYKTFEYKEEIPYKKIDFYGQVYAALFNDHDKTKGSAYVHEKKTKLDKYQFEQILRAFGFLALKSDKVEYSDQLIHQLLGQSIKRFSWLKISIDDFLYDITHTVPFIQKDGNEYKWVHKSFMEYFASCFICFDNKGAEERCFAKMIKNDYGMKYYNTLDFCYEMDTLGFRKYVIFPFLCKFIEKYEISFCHDIFSGWNGNEVCMAKQILSLAKDIYIERRIKNQHELISINNNWNLQVVEESEIDSLGNVTVILVYFDLIDEMVYKIVEKRIPELFKCYNVNKNISMLDSNESSDVKFNDDIENHINKSEDTFRKITHYIYDCIFGQIALDYSKAKTLADTIKAEEIFSNNDAFEL